MVRKLRSDYYSKQIEENSGDMKRTWKILKQAINKESNTVTIDKIVSDNHEITDKALISEAFNEHFNSVAEKFAVSINPCDSNPLNSGIFRRTKSSMPLINLKMVNTHSWQIGYKLCCIL